MRMDEIEKLNMVVLLCINFITLLKNSRALDLLTIAQRNFRHEVRSRFDNLDPGDRS